MARHWWALVVGLGVLTVLSKAAGVLVLSGRRLPDAVVERLGLLAPALLAALVVTQTLLDGGRVLAGARLGGVVAGGLVLALRAPLWAGVVTAAATAALLRILGLP